VHQKLIHVSIYMSQISLTEHLVLQKNPVKVCITWLIGGALIFSIDKLARNLACFGTPKSAIEVTRKANLPKRYTLSFCRGCLFGPVPAFGP
jgi:hypothetical protein